MVFGQLCSSGPKGTRLNQQPTRGEVQEKDFIAQLEDFLTLQISFVGLFKVYTHFVFAGFFRNVLCHLSGFQIYICIFGLITFSEETAFLWSNSRVRSLVIPSVPEANMKGLKALNCWHTPQSNNILRGSQQWTMWNTTCYTQTFRAVELTNDSYSSSPFNMALPFNWTADISVVYWVNDAGGLILKKAAITWLLLLVNVCLNSCAFHLEIHPDMEVEFRTSSPWTLLARILSCTQSKGHFPVLCHIILWSVNIIN